jgi:rod shape-determining protein MreC
VGSGEADTLQLPYLPIQSDIREGDELVTSGLGGVYPAGHPVATITAVDRGGGSPLAQVRAKPLAALDRDREVLFVWFRAAHPAAPADETPEPAAAAALALQPVVVAPMATTPAAAAPAPTPAAAPAPTTSAVQPMGATP